MITKLKSAVKKSAKKATPKPVRLKKAGSSPVLVLEKPAADKGSVRELRTAKVTWLKKPSGLAQIYTSGLEYAFVSEDNKQVCPFVFCKDFLQDALMAYHNNKPACIYGFTYSKENQEQICLDRTKLVIANAKDKNFSSKIPAMLNFIHQVERELRLVRSTIKLVESPPSKYKNGVYLLESSSRWMLAPPMISLFSLLIRVGFVHEKGKKYQETIDGLKNDTIKPYQSEDANQIRDAQLGFDRIRNHGYARVFWNDPSKNYPAISENSMHYDMGICAFSSQSSKKYVKHWHRDLDKKKAAESAASAAKV